MPDFLSLPRNIIQIDAGSVQSQLEPWRHTLGHGAVNSLPFPPKVVQGLRKLQPRLIRVFLQEYFNVYPDHGVFDWSKLDVYMDSLAATGAKVQATINLKPRVLYPVIDHTIWRPNDVGEWQNLIYQLVKRYSVDRPIVTHWECFNEPDLGENGGCPYCITDVNELHEFYALTMQAVKEAFPQAKVGGPCPAHPGMVPEFVRLCAQHKTPLDFVSYHIYDDHPERHAALARQMDKVVQGYPGERPELMVDEWSRMFETSDEAWKGRFDLVSVEEMAMQSRRAAHLLRILFELMDSPLDWSFFFLIWDNCMFHQEFEPFFSKEGIWNTMYIHWNETPHRFGLFSESAKLRPQYFMYWFLSQMTGRKLSAENPEPDLQVLSEKEGGRLSILVNNFNLQRSQDRIVRMRFKNLVPGVKRLTAYRIDNDHRWSDETLEAIPYETRLVDTLDQFQYQFFSPADSILWVRLDDAVSPV